MHACPSHMQCSGKGWIHKLRQISHIFLYKASIRKVKATTDLIEVKRYLRILWMTPPLCPLVFGHACFHPIFFCAALAKSIHHSLCHFYKCVSLFSALGETHSSVILYSIPDLSTLHCWTQTLVNIVYFKKKSTLNTGTNFFLFP